MEKIKLKGSVQSEYFVAPDNTNLEESKTQTDNTLKNKKPAFLGIGKIFNRNNSQSMSAKKYKQSFQYEAQQDTDKLADDLFKTMPKRVRKGTF